MCTAKLREVEEESVAPFSKSWSTGEEREGGGRKRE
jgi:hypothetical protein